MLDLFTPDSETEARFKAQVSAIIAGKRISDSIDMGRLPALYSELGIVDKELKTNATTILKALGLKGKNIHHVPKETLENLLSLVYDPEAVCRSLYNSNNPKSYVAILNAKAKDDKQIIAILRPSEDGKGYAFIPSVYEKDNFERYLAQFAKEERGLYVKEKGSELWGRLQSPPRHNSEPINNILTKDDIVKHYFERESKMQINMSSDKNIENNSAMGDFVQGVCECANITKQKNVSLACLKDLEKILRVIDEVETVVEKAGGKVSRGFSSLHFQDGKCQFPLDITLKNS